MGVRHSTARRFLASRFFSRLVGTWSGTETFAPSPWSASGVASSLVTMRMELDDRVLVQDYTHERIGQSPRRVHAVIVLGEYENQLNLFWFDGLGAPPASAPGYWEDERLVFVRSAGIGRLRHACTLIGDNSYTCRLEGSFDGGRTWSTVSHGEYVRI
jgi:hypothetical protein